jgi:hypothetical protein
MSENFPSTAHASEKNHICAGFWLYSSANFEPFFNGFGHIKVWLKIKRGQRDKVHFIGTTHCFNTPWHIFLSFQAEFKYLARCKLSHV